MRTVALLLFVYLKVFVRSQECTIPGLLPHVQDAMLLDENVLDHTERLFQTNDRTRYRQGASKITILRFVYDWPTFCLQLQGEERHLQTSHHGFFESLYIFLLLLPSYGYSPKPGVCHSRFVTSLELFWLMPETSFFKVSALEPLLALMTMETRQIAMNSARRLKGASTTPTTLLTLPV